MMSSVVLYKIYNTVYLFSRNTWKPNNIDTIFYTIWHFYRSLIIDSEDGI